jgi:four helix bundle protein
METGNGTRDAGSPTRRAIRSYDDLEVYQRSMQLLVPLHKLVRVFPEYEKYELASQLRRASKSIPANIAEGYGKKRSAKEFKAYLANALGSANEVIVHLKVTDALGYADGREISELIDGYTIVAKQLHTLIGAWQSFDSRSGELIPPPASRIQPPRSLQ